MITFGFYGRSGQGVGKAVNLLAKACFASGLYVQSFSSVPQNRRGSPVMGLVKTSTEPIMSRQLEEPDYYVVLDAQLMPKTFRENSVLILNAPQKPASEALKKRKVKVYSLDATGIALMVLKANVPNTAMLGAVTKLFNKVSMKS